MKEQKEKERNEETRQLLRENEFINAWEIIKETNESKPWTNYDTFDEYIVQNKNKSKEQISEAREYFAKELIRIIVKNWKYNYPREQFEETEENIANLITKEQNNFELSDLKTRIRLAKNKCLQHYLSTLKQFRRTGQLPTMEEIEKLTEERMHQNPLNLKNTFKRQPLENKLLQTSPITQRRFGKNIQWKDIKIGREISISKQTEKYKESREKLNSIFDKPSKEEIMETHNRDPFTYINKSRAPTHEQPLTKHKVKLPFNKSDEPINTSPFDKPLFNQLTMMQHPEETYFVKIATKKKNELTEGQYQDWMQQMFQKIEKQHRYNTLHNEGKQFSLKTIMTDRIKEGYDNLHEMLNHDQLKLNFIVIDGAIAVGKTTMCHWLKTWYRVMTKT
ncbi:hypothetical protein F8M41_017461 [Gigaspora margarita]|uniref:Uncharacterized protein n=1 Tax=Gigaspora margarita TaxID=4874 RepID=A0A8H4EM35_GIGMA|nr:hypothetical protein F8M41_017461 [Gigaspora margarita]